MVPNLVSNGVLDVAGAAAFTALIVQQTKFLIELFIKPADQNHDAVMRLYVNAVAMIVVVVASIVSGAMNVHNGAAWFSALTSGFGVGLAAISGYHLLNGMQPQTQPAPRVQQSTADAGAGGNGVHGTPLTDLQPIATPATTQSGALPVTNNSTLLAVDPTASSTDVPATLTAAVGDTSTVRIANRGDGTLASWILQARMPLTE